MALLHLIQFLWGAQTSMQLAAVQYVACCGIPNALADTHAYLIKFSYACRPPFVACLFVKCLIDFMS